MKTLFLRLLFCAAGALPALGAPPPRPNIVFILADDLGYGDLGCYGQKQLPTPNIDRLAAGGLRFTQHYAGNASCSPSRSSFLTGRHTGHTRHRDNRRFVYSYGFREGDVTFAEVMKTAGYATAICGKWHLGDRADSKDTPHHHGFDFAYCIGYPYPDRGWEHWPSHVFVNGVQTNIPGNGGGRKTHYMDDLYTDAALDFMRSHRAQPFLVFLSFQSVHAPMDGALAPQFAARDWPEAERTFASMHAKVDANVGRVLAALRELGLERNTLVFFSSDNGPHNEGGHSFEFFDSNGPLRGRKFTFYEGGLRAPLIASWPGTIAAGQTTSQVTALWDMLPTFAELGGAKLTAPIDGVSLVPTLLGRGPQAQHAYLYWESQDAKGSQAVRAGDWKGIRRGVSVDREAPIELFDLAQDPREERDLASAHADVVKRIAAIMAGAHVRSPETPLFADERIEADIPPNGPRTPGQ